MQHLLNAILLNAIRPAPRRAALLLVAVWQVAGCATVDISPVRQAWLGASYEEVVSRWGTPVRSTSFNDGRQVYTWLTEGLTTRGAARPTIGISAGSGMGVGIGIGVSADSVRDVPVTCERTLIFRDVRVIDQTWFGPADFCSTFRR